MEQKGQHRQALGETQTTDYARLLELPGLQDGDRRQLEELLKQLEETKAENARLRRTISRLSAGSRPKMSTKLKDALYE